MVDVNVYLDKRRVTEKGYPVKLRLRDRGDSTLVSTGLYADYDLVDGRFCRQEASAAVKNVTLARIVANVNEELLKLGDRKLSTKALKSFVDDVIKGKRTGRLLDYFQEYMETITNPGTRDVYQGTYNKVEEFDASVRLDDVDFAWLTDFETAQKKKGYSPNYYGQMERNIRTVFNYCIDREYTSNYPFRRFKTKSEKTVKRALTIEQVRALKDSPCQKYQEKYKDLFMLTIYMQGISPVDLFNLPHVPVTVGSIIDLKRKKDGKKDAGYVRIVLCQEAVDIIKKYEGHQHLLHFMDGKCKKHKDFLHRWNDGLKKIGPMRREGRCKVIEPLFPWISPTCARHTFATLCAQLGISKYVISLAMGHAEAGVTEIYINPDYRLAEEATRKVVDWIFERGETR